ncbi:hypothetical protein LX36DRAFT_97596 [Colletotrichum falcatum]|nr:hypothetical protein LX36DRAFT_97596 [Colletotrichum falcatum]
MPNSKGADEWRPLQVLRCMHNPSSFVGIGGSTMFGAVCFSSSPDMMASIPAVGLKTVHMSSNVMAVYLDAYERGSIQSSSSPGSFCSHKKPFRCEALMVVESGPGSVAVSIYNGPMHNNAGRTELAREVLSRTAFWLTRVAATEENPSSLGGRARAYQRLSESCSALRWEGIKTSRETPRSLASPR